MQLRVIVAALASLALHLLAVFALATLVFEVPPEDRERILVTVARAAAAPPPRMIGDLPGRETSAPEWWERTESEALRGPRAVARRKEPTHPAIRRKPPAKPGTEPSAANVEPNRVVAAPPAGGTSGGVAGGVPDGQVGGLIGGRDDSVLRLDQVASPPRIVARITPKYPPLARARGLEGVVVLEAVVDRQGHVESNGLHVVQSHDPFDHAAVDAFQRWRFEPARDAKGEPVRVLVRQAIRFELR